MSAVEKLFAMGGIDMAASVKAAGDGIANLNAHLARVGDNTAAIAQRLEAIDAHQLLLKAQLDAILARLPQP